MRKRPSARLLVLDPQNRILLFHFRFDEGPLAGKQYWATPGGALEPGENYQEAAWRELYEETGISGDVGEEVAQRDVIFETPSGDSVMADERYFLVRVSDNRIDKSGQGAAESQYMRAHKWWSPEDIRETSEVVFPEELEALLMQLSVK
ncbi:NUDIX hydrolase [Denitrobaculum tricleocarpae]|uniref:NUDIX domain-containing protein n=1 Tax=Denitrobaculum tricleocarpae TaxID=2591009 RepID=A0A545U323_9PROT|nr:NUDIX domain-containing protein [Denitrobaculum tricleocarpae]TQV83871.1 NUDIX domain-containing protein [Denitrobaculum tricleocarpae]